MADKTTTAETVETPVRKSRQVNATVTADQFDQLEGYAFGTRRKQSELVKDIIVGWLDDNQEEIKARYIAKA